ncbi:MAG: PpqE2 [uncultured bacterium (gcode 4)]|uniref:PpqE2 n=1 Tax=uncultured bacterium (gcode 4) TaxID=1234023 RepID=K2G4S1_9BACT|nr:MAG: PpqE2 [uncultured bacterium (gcode 4)]
MLKFYYINELLIRKEHFWILILSLDGRRFVIDIKYFKLLKRLNWNDESGLMGLFPEFDKDGIIELTDSLIDKWILIKSDVKLETNVKFIENQLISEDSLSFPRTVYWETSWICNFKCLHCYSQLHNNSCRWLDLDSIKKLIDEMAWCWVEFFNVWGWEPLLYEHIFDVIKYCKQVWLTIEMTSNWSLLHDENISRLKESGLKFIQISIDWSNEETFEKIRIWWNFNQVTESVRKLVKAWFTVSINTVLTKLNHLEILDIIKLSQELGASFYKVSPLMETWRWKTNKNSLKLTKSELRGVYSKILKHQINYKKGDMKVIFNINLIKPTIKNIFWMKKWHYWCPAWRTTCGIDSYGNVYPCSYMHDDALSCGNIKKNTLKQIWTASHVLKELRSVTDLEWKCKDCRYLDICSGWCRASAFLKHWNLNQSDPLCVVK